MYHELLFALLGYTGELVVETPLPRAKKTSQHLDNDPHHRDIPIEFSLHPALTFLSSSEYQLLNPLLQLGAGYKYLHQFIRGNDNGNPAAPTAGLYLSAFQQGIATFLNEYENHVLALEMMIQQEDGHGIPYTQWYTHFKQYLYLYPYICRLVQDIQVHQYHGVTLLSAIYKATKHGVPYLRKTMLRLLWSCHQVLWNQLIQWMVYGKVFDPMDEFFIVEQLKIDETTDDPEVEKDSQCRRIQFQLKMERIPTLYFSTNLAEKVYFIGQTMSIFQRQTRELVSNNNPYVSEFLPTCERLKLEPEFDLLTVETEVEGMRKSVARGFWTIVVDEGQLRAHLRALKDYFLLSNGTLYQEFIETSRVLMSSVATERAVKDLYRGPFLQSARNCLDLDQDPYFQRLELHVPIQNFTWTCPTSKKVASSLRSSSSSTFEVSGILDGIYSKDNLNNSMGTMSCMEPKQVSTGFQSILNFSIPNSDNSNRDWSIIFCFDTQSRVSNIRRAREDDDDSPGIVSTASSCVMVEVSAKGIRSSSYCVDTHTWTVEEAWVQSNNLQKLFSQHDRDSHTLIVEYKHKILKVIDDRRNVVFQWKITKPPLINLFHQCQYLRIIALDDRLDNQAQRHHIQVNQWSFSKPYEKPEESWQSLSLRYTSPWPVHTIITPESIESYNRMFRFLFRLKQINQDIEHGWSILGRSHRESSPAVGEILSHPIWYRSMCILRSKMNFLIQHLQFYIQVHVIEVQFQELMATIEASSITRDFESIRLVHQRYLATCVSKCFLNVETIQRAFAQVLSSCGAFGKWLISTVGKGTETSETQVAQLETFEREFHDTSKYLFLVLQHSDAHDLVLQLDFNCYWTEQVHLEMD